MKFSEGWGTLIQMVRNSNLEANDVDKKSNAKFEGSVMKVYFNEEPDTASRAQVKKVSERQRMLMRLRNTCSREVETRTAQYV